MASTPPAGGDGELHVSFPSYVVAAGVAALGVGLVEQVAPNVAWLLSLAVFGSVLLVGGPDGLAALAQTVGQALHIPAGAHLGAIDGGHGTTGELGGEIGGTVAGAARGAIAAAQSVAGRVAYVWGGSSPTSGFDCSGLIQWAFGQVGVTLPRTAAAQYATGTAVDAAHLQPGDVVFFRDTNGSGISHNGIYLGGGRFLHAADEAHGIITSLLTNDYWAQHFAGARHYG